MEVMLFSITDPIIESCSDINFITFNYGYPLLKQQISSAGLSLWNNNWTELYDFTPSSSKLNYSLQTESGADFMPTI